MIKNYGRSCFMKKKISMVLFFTILFGLISAVSVFAAPPPNGRYMAVGNYGESSIMIYYMPYSQKWEVTVFNRGGDIVCSAETTDFSDGGTTGSTYYIRFNYNGNRIVLEYSHVNKLLKINSGNLPGVGGTFSL
jgi:hypothetical protein